MANPKQWTSSEAAAAQVKAFIAALQLRLGDAAGPPFVVRVTADLAAIELGHAAWAVDEPARANLHMLSALLAAYRALEGSVDQRELREMLRECFTGQFKDVIKEGTKRWLDAEADPFPALVQLSKAKRKESFGAGFTSETERDDDGGYVINFTRCFYHDFLAANGVPELTPLFCEFDAGWIQAIDPDRHRVRFERPTTIGHGGPSCPFRFLRVEPPRRA